MTPRIKKTEEPLIQAEAPLDAPIAEEPAKRRGRPKKEVLPDTDMLPLTLGVVLQQARQAKHMKLPSISKKLKIKEVYLEALETGDYRVFPALVYGVGFLRSYAAFLGLNPDEMVARFHKETTDIKEEPLDMPRSHDAKILPSPKTAFLSLILLLLIYVFWNVFQIMTENPLETLAKPVPAQTVTIAIPEGPAPITADEMPAPEVIEADSAKPEVQPQTAETGSKPTEVKRTPAVYGLKTPARVSFVATGKTTIEVRDLEANSTLLKKTLESGDRYNPVADSEGLALKTTDAGALDVYVDGKKVKTLGKKGQVKTGVQMDAANLLKD